MSRALAIVCGGGGLPLEAAQEARKNGREPFLVGLSGSAAREIESYPHLWVRLGEVGKLFSALKARDVEDVAFLGSVTRPDFADLMPDWGAIQRAGEIAKLFRGGDDMLMRGVARLFEAEGFHIVGPRDFAPGLLAPRGEIVGPRPGEDARADIDDPAGFQRRQQLADLAEPHPKVRVGLDLTPGGADESDQEDLTPRLLDLARRLERQAARAANDSERRTHAGSSPRWRGVVTPRSPPSRRKATMACTAALSGYSRATCSTRCFRVPSSANKAL